MKLSQLSGLPEKVDVSVCVQNKSLLEIWANAHETRESP